MKHRTTAALFVIALIAAAPAAMATSFSTAPRFGYPTEDYCLPSPPSLKDDYDGALKHGFCFDVFNGGEEVEYGVYERGIKQGVWVSKHPCCSSRGKYRDGKKDGYWVYEESPLMMQNQAAGYFYRKTGSYHDGKRHGEWIWWYGLKENETVYFCRGEKMKSQHAFRKCARSEEGDTKVAELEPLSPSEPSLSVASPACGENPMLTRACDTLGLDRERALKYDDLVQLVNEHCAAEAKDAPERLYGKTDEADAALAGMDEADKNALRLATAYGADFLSFDIDTVAARSRTCRAALHIHTVHPEKEIVDRNLGDMIQEILTAPE